MESIVTSFIICFSILAINFKKKFLKHQIISLFFLCIISDIDHSIYGYFFHGELYRLIIPELLFIFTLYCFFSLIDFIVCRFFMKIKKINYGMFLLPFGMVALRYFLGWNK